MAQQRTRASHWETVMVPVVRTPRPAGISGAGSNLSLHGPKTSDTYELERVLTRPELYEEWYVDMVLEQHGRL